MTPGLDGLSALRAMRQAKVAAPAIFLTALGESDDRVEGLRAGGDDDRVKLFAFSELLARIEVLTRRPGATEDQSSQISVGDIAIDVRKRSCVRQGRVVDLNPKESSSCLRSSCARRVGCRRAPCCLSASGA